MALNPASLSKDNEDVMLKYKSNSTNYGKFQRIALQMWRIRKSSYSLRMPLLFVTFVELQDENPHNMLQPEGKILLCDWLLEKVT